MKKKARKFIGTALLLLGFIGLFGIAESGNPLMQICWTGSAVIMMVAGSKMIESYD